MVVARIPAEADSTWAGPVEDNRSLADHTSAGRILAGEDSIRLLHLHRSSRWQSHPEEESRDRRRGREEGTKVEGSPVDIMLSWVMSTGGY